MRILRVCLGNICRSPMAEGAIRRMAGDAGIPVDVDSAGTGDWHLGQPPEPTALAVAAARGYDNADQRARQVTAEDFAAFDLILAMDSANLETLRRLAPDGTRAEIRLFDPEGRDIPDPYRRGRQEYERALDMVEHATGVLLAELSRR